jgi:hypothetical protein
MRFLSSLFLLGMAFMGCSAQPGTPQAGRDIANIAPEGRLTEEVASSGPDSSLAAVTVHPPPILLTPIQENTPEPARDENSPPPVNWQAFTSSTLEVTINYPSDWSVTDETEIITFTSPTGARIQLRTDTVATGNREFKIGNQYCVSRTNEHGQIANVCVDRAASIYTAQFSLQKANNSIRLVTLVTKARTVGEVFEMMFNSLQPVN